MSEAKIAVIKHNYLEIYVNSFVMQTDRHSVFIDSGLCGNEALLDPYLPGKTPVVLCTHGHWDHIGLHRYLKERGAVLMAHPGDRRFLTDFTWHWRYLFGQYEGDFALPPARREVFVRRIGSPVAIDRELADGQTIQIEDLVFTVFHLPGHSDGSVCLLERSSGALFTGDTLMGDGFFDSMPLYSDVEAFLSSMERIVSLEPAVVYSAHSEPMDGAMASVLARRGMARARSVGATVEEYIYQRRDDETITLGEIIDWVCARQGKKVSANACVSILAHLRVLQRNYPMLAQILQTHEI